MDRRTLRANGSVAHVSLEGHVDAPRFVQSTTHHANLPTVDILNTPKGTRERQLVFGEVFHVLEDDGQHAFGYADKDGYVGWISSGFLKQGDPATHKIAVPRAIGLEARDVKTPGTHSVLPLGARVHASHPEGEWIKVTVHNAHLPVVRFMRRSNLCALDEVQSDPVSVAQSLLGTPYLWGGNSALGIDCSGLIQAACLACAIPCPGDSDQQERAMGETVSGPPQRGDILFWKGHVAMVVDPSTLIHANAHSMNVAYEGIEAAKMRITAQGEGPVTRHARMRQV